jgi:BirA family biotin operon repressor/biotin-[acetyl-CoA-carboxylase] ligase
MTKAPVQGGDKERDALPLVAKVFARLADGEFHSGQELAEALGVSRGAVWKAVESLRALGATLHAVRNRGYRLKPACDALDAEQITNVLLPRDRAHVSSVDVAWTVDSTNSVLLARPNPPLGKCEVMLAEYQTAGRGRRGRAWLAPPGGSICLSLCWTFEEVPKDLGALGLVIGVCALQALRSLHAARQDNVEIKWPNDLVVEGKKLGGILIELRAESDGPACVVIGIGINVALGAKQLETIGAAGASPIDLVTAGVERPRRNVVAAGLITQFSRGLLLFEREGLRPFAEEWRAADALRGRQIDVHTHDGVARGLARGIDLHGALVVETPTGVRRFISGDVTVRAVG